LFLIGAEGAITNLCWKFGKNKDKKVRDFIVDDLMKKNDIQVLRNIKFK
jgi:hypothetical protein